MANKNEENVINILEEHKVYKKQMENKWFYFGEMSKENKPMNIGMFSSQNSETYGSFIMMERITGFLKGEGMCILKNHLKSICSVGYCYNGVPIGPQLISYENGDLCYCTLNEEGNKIGFAIDIKKKKYTIYQCFGDGSSGYRGISCENGVLYFEDARRREKNKRVQIFKDNKNCSFAHAPLEVDFFWERKAIMPSKITKNNAKSFTVSGGVQTYKEGNRIKSEYDDYFKELKYDGSFPDGYGIKYYDNAYFFGQFNSKGKREKAGCLRKNDIAFMGSFSDDALYGPVLTIENNVPRLCSYYNGKKNGTYFEVKERCLFIKSKIGDKEGEFAYKVYLDTFDVEEIDLTNNEILRFASYPFKEDDEESLRQEEERNNELEILKSLGLNHKDYEELENFNYVIEDRQIKIISLKEPASYLNIPKCASILSDNAFKDEYLCDEIVTVVIGDKVLEIGENCFSGCKKLSKISMGKNVKEIKKGAFKSSLFERVYICDSTKIIRTEAFAECENLREAYVPDDCLIEEGAFPEWTQLTSRKDQDKRIKKAIRGANPLFKITDFIAGIFKKKKKKRKITPGEVKKIKEKVEKENKKKNEKVKEKKVKKEVEKRNKTSFSEKIQDVLRILALPFVYIGKGIAFLFASIGALFIKMFKGIGRFLSDIEITKDHILMALPFILLLAYTIFAFVYGVDKLEAINTSKVMYDGYDWELSGLASNWLEETDHNLLTAITLGLIQIIFIVIGFILDIVLTIVIFVLGLILLVFAGILKFVVMELLPLVVIIGYLLMLKLSSKANKNFALTCMIFSLVVGVMYYIVLFR